MRIATGNKRNNRVHNFSHMRVKEKLGSPLFHLFHIVVTPDSYGPYGPTDSHDLHCVVTEKRTVSLMSSKSIQSRLIAGGRQIEIRAQSGHNDA